MSLDQLTQTLIELVGIPSTSGHEEHVRSYLEQRSLDRSPGPGVSVRAAVDAPSVRRTPTSAAGAAAFGRARTWSAASGCWTVANTCPRGKTIDAECAHGSRATGSWSSAGLTRWHIV